ncbi:hypothetical protein SAMN05660860_01197 [Geoalkalibacter ferrihydriticus]|uniref:Uncharacterized protein n=2 Tax=Geoalkalibacter ferrihydriticus TaxID=392333 RepID=A0A0C2HKY5_9BACT|nr:hypothetical protein [Geoalkalibacter ferrihydriticus]KIH77716.1 hypothetical protein GFER_03400 [Geoalkalibacter ferrihydriticus DSM 17813]SDL75427.1 hypothetical protein SAMN05660860_01197 [Geoalkalibacter ferrihydriticus]
MKKFTLIVFLTCCSLALLLLLPVVAASPSEDSSPNHIRVADPIEWPKLSEESLFDILVENFLFQSFVEVRRISTVGDRLLVFARNGGVLHFDPVSAEDLRLPGHPQGFPEQSSISISRFGQLPFVKTPKDSIPESALEETIWQEAMALRADIFGESNPVLCMERGDVIIYFYESPAPPFGHYASVHDQGRDTLFLHIAAQGMKFDDFQTFLATAVLRK